ncbi:hypothetical protein Tco_1274757 [Tanacetum coccineum]
MTSLSKKFERLKEIPGEHGINPSLPLPEQDPSLPQAKRGRQLNWNLRFASLVLSVIAVFLKASETWDFPIDKSRYYKDMVREFFNDNAYDSLWDGSEFFCKYNGVVQCTLSYACCFLKSGWEFSLSNSMIIVDYGIVWKVMDFKWMVSTGSGKYHMWGFPYVTFSEYLKEWYANLWHKDVPYKYISYPRLYYGLFASEVLFKWKGQFWFYVGNRVDGLMAWMVTVLVTSTSQLERAKRCAFYACEVTLDPNLYYLSPLRFPNLWCPVPSYLSKVFSLVGYHENGLITHLALLFGEFEGKVVLFFPSPWFFPLGFT